MKILLVSTNQAHSPWPVYPLGLAYVDASLRRQGFETRRLDLCFTKSAGDEAAAAVREFAPDCIGLSIRNVDNLTYGACARYLPGAKAVVEACRRATSAPIVVGGPGFSAIPLPMLRYLELDTGVVGEGEVAFPTWLRQGGAGPVPGVVSLRQGTPAEGAAPSRIGDLDALPFPTRDRALLRRYASAGGAANVQTKRGCSFQCVYCNYPRLEGCAVRMRSPQNVVDELAELAALGVREFHFVDSVFTHPTAHAIAICEEILRRRLRVSWTCGANPISLTAELAQLMARAGCAGVELGIDAANDPMLAAMQKGFGFDQVVRCDQACHEAKLPVMFHLILGGPGETPESVEETIAAMRRLHPRAITYSYGLRVFPGTPLADRMRREGSLASEDDLLEPRFYVSPHLGPDFGAQLSARARREPCWFSPEQRETAAVKLMLRLASLAGLKTPLWTHGGISASFKRAAALLQRRRPAAGSR